MPVRDKHLLILAMKNNPSLKGRVYAYRKVDSHTIKLELANPQETVIFRYHNAYTWAFMSEDYYKNY